jgi:hypothetical protein
VRSRSTRIASSIRRHPHQRQLHLLNARPPLASSRSVRPTSRARRGPALIPRSGPEASKATPLRLLRPIPPPVDPDAEDPPRQVAVLLQPRRVDHVGGESAEGEAADSGRLRAASIPAASWSASASPGRRAPASVPADQARTSPLPWRRPQPIRSSPSWPADRQHSALGSRHGVGTDPCPPDRQYRPPGSPPPPTSCNCCQRSECSGRRPGGLPAGPRAETGSSGSLRRRRLR